MSPKEFFDTVAAMRDAQKRWFRYHIQTDLTESKDIEKIIDKEIARVRAILAGQPEKEPSLFESDE